MGLEGPRAAVLYYRRWIQFTNRTLIIKQQNSTVLDSYTKNPGTRIGKAIESNVLSTDAVPPSPAAWTPPGTNHLTDRSH
jgi:hypothetical protein